MENLNVCFAIAKELLSPLGLQGHLRNDEKFLQAALVYVCKNGTNGASKFDDNFRTIMRADFNKERKQYFMSVRKDLWIKLKEISRDTGFPLCKLMAWGVFCVQHLQMELSAIGAKKKLNTKDAIIGTLHKDLQRIIDDLLINNDELWLIANHETRSRLLILVDMADYVYDLVKKELEKGK